MRKARWVAGLLAGYLWLIIMMMSACSGEAELKTFPCETGEAFVTNLKGEEKRMLKSQITLETYEEKMVLTLTEKQYAVRDIITRVLRELSLEDAGRDDILTSLEQTIMDKLNEEFGSEAVCRVYFSTFVTANT